LGDPLKGKDNAPNQGSKVVNPEKKRANTVELYTRMYPLFRQDRGEGCQGDKVRRSHKGKKSVEGNGGGKGRASFKTKAKKKISSTLEVLL